MNVKVGKSKDWIGGFICGIASSIFVSLLIAILYSSRSDYPMSNVAMRNFSIGAFGSIPARVFTFCNLVVSVLPFLVWSVRRVWYCACFSFCRRLPTMIGMLGTLWSLLDSDMTNPGALAQKFSIAIVSTFVGLILQIALEGVGRLPVFSCLRNEEYGDGEKR